MDLKERIRQVINYKQFYSKYLDLRTPNPTTKEAMVRCPFHDDKVPSFSVNIENGRWKCFGCLNEGDEFTFYQNFKQVDFNTALREISKDLGINTPEPKSYLDANAPEKYHQALLNSPELKKYLNEKRGLTDETIKLFKLGYSNSWEKYSIPIFAENGKLVNIKYYSPNPKQYKNSLNRHASLFGVDKLVKGDGEVLVAEGEFDCMMLHQNGFVAVSGTTGANTFKEEWAQYFKGRKVRIIYDTDEAGISGAQKVADILSKVAEEVKIITLPLKEGKDVTDYFLNGGTKEELEEVIKQTENIQIHKNIFLLLPESLPAFIKRDIPPIEYYISWLLQKKGRGMVSATKGIGKSIFVQNLALAMSCGKTNFLEKFMTSPAKVLYLDLEMGESAIKERFQKMCATDNLVAENLYVKYLPYLNLLDSAHQQLCEGWLTDLGIEVLILDPLGNAWSGNENSQEQVNILQAYLNGLIARFNLSLLITHHWKKATKDFKTGGQMAAGSYRWEAWLDYHVTLEGKISSLTISSEKGRNRVGFDPFIARLNTDTLWFEFLTDYVKKYDESTLQALFNSFGSERVAIPRLIKQAKEQGGCSHSTLRKLIKESTLFEVDTSQKTHYLVKKGYSKDLLDEVISY